ncbi:hypothetical protein V8C43DRAFT_133534 [Trichoderma afarasin]
MLSPVGALHFQPNCTGELVVSAMGLICMKFQKSLAQARSRLVTRENRGETSAGRSGISESGGHAMVSNPMKSFASPRGNLR